MPDGSFTVSHKNKRAMNAAVKKLTGKGLVADADVFPVAVEVPDWLDQYRSVASSMSEHGG